MISGIQQENRHIRALQQENKELRAALEEHQNAIELIMSKYRQHMSHLLHQTRLDSSFIVNREKAAVSKKKIEISMYSKNILDEYYGKMRVRYRVTHLLADLGWVD